MICDNCKIDRLVTDFLNNQKFCFHCMYRIKLEKDKEKRTHKKSRCRTCGKEFAKEESITKRQRTVFCSCECATEGHKEQIDNYWTRKIASGNLGVNYKNKRGHAWSTTYQKLIPHEKRRGKYTAMRRLREKKA